jgi:hypothetical protein
MDRQAMGRTSTSSRRCSRRRSARSSRRSTRCLWSRLERVEDVRHREPSVPELALITSVNVGERR